MPCTFASTAIEAWELHTKTITEFFHGDFDDLGTAHLQACQEAVRMARVTQLETVICKTLMKSKKPHERVSERLASYAQETRRDGAGEIWKELAQHIEAVRKAGKK